MIGALLRDRSGFSLAVVLLVVILLAALAVSLSAFTVATRTETEMALDVDRAAYIARAGFERTSADLLMHADQWDTLTTDPYADETFDQGAYTVTLLDLTADAATVNVAAEFAGRTHEIAFRAARETNGVDVPTTGVTLVSIDDKTLDVLVR